MKSPHHYKFLATALLVVCLAYHNQTFAFGDAFKAIADAVFVGILGPGDGNFPSPPQKDRLINIVDKNSIKFGAKDKVISGTGNYKLAVIKSSNVDEQISAYQKYVDWYLKLVNSYASTPAPIVSEANTFIGGNQYYDKAVNLLKTRFSSTIYPKDLKEAFEQGADYVAVVDIKLEFKPLGTETGPLSVSNTADISLLVIDKSLNAAPDIIIQNTVIDNYEGKGPDQNFKTELALLKAVRDKTFSEFETQLNKALITEADDPPVKGIRLNLSDVAEPKQQQVKTKQKTKKKN